jgi:hypothetical protein
VYTPKLAPIPKLKSPIMIQKEGSFRMIRRVLRFGASPGKSPPFPKRIKIPPETSEPIPDHISTPRHEKTPKSASARRGAMTKARLGASS